MERRLWKCPECGETYRIPADAADPMLCQTCEEAAETAKRSRLPVHKEESKLQPAERRQPIESQTKTVEINENTPTPASRNWNHRIITWGALAGVAAIVLIGLVVIFTQQEPQEPPIRTEIFDDLNRAAKSFEAAQSFGVNMEEFEKFLQAYLTELNITKDVVVSTSEKEVLQHYSNAYEKYSDSLTLWKYQKGTRYITRDIPRETRMAMESRAKVKRINTWAPESCGLTIIQPQVVTILNKYTTNFIKVEGVELNQGQPIDFAFVILPAQDVWGFAAEDVSKAVQLIHGKDNPPSE